MERSSRLIRLIALTACVAAFALLARELASAQSTNAIFRHYSNRAFLALFAAGYVLCWLAYILLSRQALRRKVLSCAAMTMTLLLLYGAIEGAAFVGLVDYSKIIAPPESVYFTTVKAWDNPGNVPDRDLLHLHKPNRHITGDTVGDLVYWLGIGTTRRYNVDMQYDSRGFRNAHDLTSAPVVMIGDSFVEAGLTPLAETISSDLSRLLTTEVANLGQSGYGPQQELVVLQRYGVELRPSVVVWLFFEGNDLLDVTRYEDTRKHWDDMIRKRNSFAGRSFTNSALLSLMGLTSRPRADSEEARRRSCTLSGQGSEKIYFGYKGLPLTAADESSLQTVFGTLEKAETLSRSVGARLVVGFVPIKYRVYRDLCSYPADGYGKEWIRNDLPSRFADWTRAHGLPFIDLTAPLLTAAADGPLVYFPDDGHWNARGQEVAAKSLAAFLTSQRLLPGSASR